jgi:5'-deoxynucleotidase YfbR-like HD superfamily hydrolase
MENVINGYLKIIELKNVLRTGWVEVGVSKEKVESVMDHIGGTIILAMLINNAQSLNLDMSKVYEMIAIHEFKKLENNMKLSIGTNESYTTDKTLELLSDFSNSDRLIALYNELKAGVSEEAKFVSMITKLESDIQAKYYEKNGEFTVENAKRDIEGYPEELKAKLTDISKASDGWLTYDAQFYNDYFKELSGIVKKM